MTRASRILLIIGGGLCAVVLLWRVSAYLRPAPPPPKGVPVRAVRATRRDTSPFLSDIATVQPFNMVLVRSRVDGQISRVAFAEGSQVNKGDVLFELDHRPFEAQLRAALAQKARDSAQLENARRDLARYQSLVNDDAGAVQTLDTTRAQVAQLEAALGMDQAQIDSAQLQLTYSTITAPFEGRTGARLVDVGNIVHASDSTGLVVLTQIHPIALTFSLPQATLPSVRAQQDRHRLRVLAMDAAGKRTLDEGELTLIDNQIDPSTGTFRCKAIFPNTNEPLWPGQFVNARVMLEKLPNAVVIPVAAVQSGSQGSYVYIVGTGAAAQVRPVQVAQTSGGEAVISQGLEGNEQVIVEGQFRLEPGTRVDVANPLGPAAAAR
jgi:membrane fusion protein, multidrug efflux system